MCIGYSASLSCCQILVIPAVGQSYLCLFSNVNCGVLPEVPVVPSRPPKRDVAAYLLKLQASSIE